MCRTIFGEKGLGQKNIIKLRGYDLRELVLYFNII